MKFASILIFLNFGNYKSTNTMKKFLFGILSLILVTGCTRNGRSEKEIEDSMRIADSIAQIEAAKIAAEQAIQDSIRQDSIAKAEAAAQYDKLLDDYLKATTNLESYGKKAKQGINCNYDEVYNVIKKCVDLEAQIKKIKSKLTPEQLETYKRAWKKYDNNISWFAD